MLDKIHYYMTEILPKRSKLQPNNRTFSSSSLSVFILWLSRFDVNLFSLSKTQVTLWIRYRRNGRTRKCPITNDVVITWRHKRFPAPSDIGLRKPIRISRLRHLNIGLWRQHQTSVSYTFIILSCLIYLNCISQCFKIIIDSLFRINRWLN